MTTSQIARAVVLKYTETGIGSGQLDGVNFSNATITLGMTTESTAQVPEGSGIRELIAPMTVTVSGIGADAFTNAGSVVSNNNGGLLVFGDAVQNYEILADRNAIFYTYDLLSPVGPISGTTAINAGQSFPTAQGTFDISSMSTVSFQATLVPEPPAFFALACVPMMVLSRRRCRGVRG